MALVSALSLILASLVKPRGRFIAISQLRAAARLARSERDSPPIE